MLANFLGKEYVAVLKFLLGVKEYCYLGKPELRMELLVLHKFTL